MTTPTAATPRKRPAEKSIPVSIDNIGGIHHADLVLWPGANELTGRNASGKTTAMQGMRRALGDKKATVEKRDGAPEGRVTVGSVVLKVGKVAKATGEAELEIQDAGPVTRIIDPGIKGSEEAAIARVRALVELIAPEFDAGSLAMIAGDGEIAREILAEYREKAFDNLSDAVDRIKRIADRHAREREALRDAASGVAVAAEQAADQALERAGGEEALIDLPVAEAELAERAATGNLAVAKEARRRRLALELQQNQIRATLGEKPNPARHDEDIRLRNAALVASDERVRDLERQISQVREEMAGVRADRDGLLKLQESETERLRTYERQAQILAQVPEGPEETEVNQMEITAQQATATRGTAQVSAQVRSLLAQARVEKEKRDTAAARAEELRSIATSVYDRMADLPSIAEKAGRFRVSVGRLYVQDGENLLDFETRQSAGQKVRATLEVAAKVYGPGSVVGLDDRFWNDLDEPSRREFGAIAASLDLYLIACRATDGDLAVHHLGAQPTDQHAAPVEVSA